jgi:hypothetical protein
MNEASWVTNDCKESTGGKFRRGAMILGFLSNPEWFFGWLFARGIGQFAETMENKGFADPVYKNNLQRLIERNRQFAEAREARYAQRPRHD